MSQFLRAATGILSIAGAIEARGALVEDQVVGPAARLAQYSVSERGARLATILPSQGKVSVLLDGVAGPAFDQVLPVRVGLSLDSAGASNLVLVVFSGDGTRWAYLARAGDDWVLMVDGKELLRLPLASGAARPSWHLAFTGDSGKHLVFFRGDQTPAALWIDGQPKPPMDAPGLVASSDGVRYAYPATLSGRSTLIVDGADAGYAATQPQFTADGQHLVSIGTSARGQSLLADGQSLYTTRNLKQVRLAPVGKDIVTVGVYYYDPDDPSWRAEDRTVVARYAALYPNGNGDFVAFDGQPVQFTQGTGAQIGRVLFSPDGRHYAAACTKGNVQYTLLDGKRGPEFATVNAASLTFSPDSSHFAYVASRDGKSYTVVDGKLSPVPDGTIRVKFSADSRRVACAGAEVVVDGQPSGLRGACTFSPDSQHLLVAGWKISDSKTGLYLDGRLVYENPQGVIAWAFSEDSHHLYWLASEPDDKLADLDDFVTYADGRAVARTYDVPAVAPLVKAISQAYDTDYGRASAMWAMGADGTVISLGPVGDRVLRTWVHPPRDTTLASVFDVRPAAPVAAAPVTGLPSDHQSFSDAFTQLHNLMMQRAKDKSAAQDNAPTSSSQTSP